MKTSRSRLLRDAVAAATIGVVLIFAATAPASAHDYLVASSPEEGSTVTAQPETISVTTNEPLLDVSGEASGFAMVVQDSDGDYYGDGCLAVEGRTLSTQTALGEGGDYTVGWQVVSADGHTVYGEFAFTWAPAGGHAAAAGSKDPPICEGLKESAASPAPPESEGPSTGTGITATDVLWVLATVAVVGLVLFATLFLLLRKRK
jgi:methionine-rich copper-binding protein CopC